jgi:hypothetical protein
MADLKPYLVLTYEPEDGSELVWAFDEASAIQAARKSSYLFTDLEEEEILVEPEKLIPGTEPTSTEPHVEQRVAIERRYGFSHEGDDHCECCGLASFDGQFPVCLECERCADCGHTEECLDMGGDVDVHDDVERGPDDESLDVDDNLPPEAGI